ncbi:hypothetical protein BD410DRAFT_797085 [Rickenella mellea]|uniref:MYND-type domain-containing protein n=1 Tax=Rickenella mellea TaxID=50990 RepID=A0A4Y7PID0_9AGAM|nr:hypothetical protein BD410DRAFT_797085 [Rickenella mellea]
MAPKARPCAVCETMSTQRCSRCALSYYCSKEHQKQDWQNHKRVCHVSMSTQALPRGTIPGRFKVDCILFPAHEIKPRLVKVEHEANRDEDFGFVFHSTKPDDYIPGSRDTRWILLDGPNGPPLRGGMGIEVIFHDEFLTDGSPPNKSIISLTGGKMNHPWRGDILAVKRTGDREKVVDISMKEDLPVLVKYFTSYGEK